VNGSTTQIQAIFVDFVADSCEGACTEAGTLVVCLKVFLAATELVEIKGTFYSLILIRFWLRLLICFIFLFLKSVFM
jgi:hypothetical protein